MSYRHLEIYKSCRWEDFNLTRNRQTEVDTMAERSAEVLVCGASIMKDVWEIRLKDYRQKVKRENERIRRSALQKITQDWHARMSYKIKTPKRLERKAKPPEESSLQTYKVKQMNVNRPQGFLSSRLQRQADSIKTTKCNKLALIRHLNESPGLMVWEKSWKFSKPSPQPEESSETCCVSDWGKSWKFLNIQSKINGKPWCDVGFDNNNNMSSNGILFLWERLGKALETQHIHQDVSAPEWKKSWVITQKREDGTTNGPKNNATYLNCKKLYKLFESHHHNQEDSQWNNAWKSTKSSNDVEVKSDLILPVSNEETQLELPWRTSWMYCKKQLNMKSKTSNHSGWSQSWRVSKTIAEQEKKSVCSQAVMPEEPLHFNVFNVIKNLSRKMKHTFHGGDTHSPEWKKSWVTVKNLSKYKEETNKEESTEKPMKEPKKMAVKIETLQSEYQHVKFNVLPSPKRQKCHEIKNILRQNERETHVSNWKDSWKMFKLQRKEQRSLRNQRHPTLQLQTSLPEWADSRKFTNLTLNQDSNLWQQGWSTHIQPRRDRRVRDVLNENIPYNGPTGVRGWGESWRSTRHPNRQQASAPTQPLNPQAYMRSVMDWEQSWQSSSDQHCHDRPSMTEWMSSWRLSSENLGDPQPKNTWFEKSMEIKARNKLFRTSYTFCTLFNSQHWNDSYRVKKRSDGTASHDLIRRETLDWDNSWMFTSADFYPRQGDYYLNCKLSTDALARNHAMPRAVQTEIKSEWGRSWKISNPQPLKNIAFWMDAKPRSFCAQDVLLWTRDKHNSYLLSALNKQPGKLKTWGASWRFVKMESIQGFNSPADESVINGTTKIRKHKYSNIDKHKPQPKRWTDACKIAKSQSRSKRDIRHKFGKDEYEDGKEEWTESWRLSNGFKRCEEMSVSMSDWKKSWKFLLDHYVPLNGPQTIKGR